MFVWSWVERLVNSLIGGGRTGGSGIAWIWGPSGEQRWHVVVEVGVTAMAGLALVAALVISSRRGNLKSPWSRRKRKGALTRQQWNSFFTPDGKFRDRGVKFLKKVRSGGVDPSIRAEVWPFLLGVYDLNSSEAERNATRAQKRKEYRKLRRHCKQLLKQSNEGERELKGTSEISNTENPLFDESPRFDGSSESPVFDGMFSSDQVSLDQGGPNDGNLGQQVCNETFPSRLSNVEEDKSEITHVDASTGDAESSDREYSIEDEPESMPMFTGEGNMETDTEYVETAPLEGAISKPNRTVEDFASWQRIIRLDAIRANAEWVAYSPTLAAISKDKACLSAVEVGLKDYEHLEPCRIYHAARLVTVLEAYAIYDPQIGYCQGMSDLLSPILAVMEEDHEAFWCFVGFMRKARHNFRLDEVGIRRQLNIVSKIIKSKDIHLYKHLEKLQAEDCFFVYRMVVVLFRRELTFEQTLCLWEVMWADQAAIRAGIGKSAWGRVRLRAPPTDNLLLYAIAASVLQRRKLIIEKYNSMDEIIRECNSMTGQLDVWKLLDDAHDLVLIGGLHVEKKKTDKFCLVIGVLVLQIKWRLMWPANQGKRRPANSDVRLY